MDSESQVPWDEKELYTWCWNEVRGPGEASQLGSAGCPGVIPSGEVVSS